MNNFHLLFVLFANFEVTNISTLKGKHTTWVEICPQRENRLGRKSDSEMRNRKGPALNGPSLSDSRLVVGPLVYVLGRRASLRLFDTTP